MNRRYRLFSAAGHMVILVLAGWFIFNLFQTIQYVRAGYSPVPVGDYWREAELWPHYRLLMFGDLWKQHNEHRILFPELTYILDMFLFRGQMYLPIVLSGLFFLGIWFVLIWAAYSQKVMQSPVREAALLLGGIILAWKDCSSVIAMPFQIQFTLLQFVSALSLAALARLSETKLATHLVMCIAAAAIGTYSSGNGMLLWIVLVAGAAVLKISKWHLIALIVSGIVFTGVYFIGYHFLPSFISVNWKHPAELFRYVCAYLSMPFGAAGSRLFIVLVGASNLVLMLAGFAYAWRRSLVKSRLGILVYGLYLFTVLTAILTALGRMEIRFNVVMQARPWRYLTIPTLAWTLLAIVAVWLAAEAFSRHLAMVVAVILALLCFQGLSRNGAWFETTRVEQANAQVVATMLKNNVFDPAEVESIFPSAAFVQTCLPVLKADRKSIYAYSDQWIGQDLSSLHPAPDAVRGAITHVRPVPGGLEIIGWSSAGSLTQDHAVLFIDSDHKVAGFGNHPAAGLPEKFRILDTSDNMVFIGYVSSPQPGSRLLAYVRTPNQNAIQPLQGAIEVP